MGEQLTQVLLVGQHVACGTGCPHLGEPVIDDINKVGELKCDVGDKIQDHQTLLITRVRIDLERQYAEENEQAVDIKQRRGVER